ncbi:MAG: ADP-ribosylglycohydrolase family protein [Stenomitos rutilans HA7619-LM2]|jgi:hypothetical protein|nr:ADP-ribosylglycohydrolase family protein [Stenomitos rutilans HA7619-LM2]
MRHPLLSRFQGTLLASALGEALGTYSRSQQALQRKGIREAEQKLPAPTPTTLLGWYPGLTFNLNMPTVPAPWGNAAVKCARALVRTGSWNELEMAAIGVQLAADRVATSASLAQPRSRKAFISAEYALATLPLTLFFYENEPKQQQILRQTVQLWQSPSSFEAVSLAVGYAIAQGLNEQMERLTLLPRTIDYLKRSTAKPTDTLLDLMGALEQTQTLLQQDPGLHTVINRLRTHTTHSCHEAIALAFYCYLSCFDDLHLSLLRAARCGEAASVVCALTGALSGSHHGLSGLPLAWRLDRPLLLLGELSNLEVCHLATHLFTVWSGSYNQSTSQPSIAIAAPGLLRPR